MRLPNTWPGGSYKPEQEASKHLDMRLSNTWPGGSQTPGQEALKQLANFQDHGLAPCTMNRTNLQSYVCPGPDETVNIRISWLHLDILGKIGSANIIWEISLSVEMG